MESIELAWKVGAAFAFLLSSFAGVVSLRSKKLAEEGDPALRERVSTLERESEHKDALIASLEKRLEKTEARANAAVTDEEFAAANQHVTTAINGLTEKVGILTGAVQGLR